METAQKSHNQLTKTCSYCSYCLAFGLAALKASARRLKPQQLSSKEGERLISQSGSVRGCCYDLVAQHRDAAAEGGDSAERRGTLVGHALLGYRHTSPSQGIYSLLWFFIATVEFMLK